MVQLSKVFYIVTGFLRANPASRDHIPVYWLDDGALDGKVCDGALYKPLGGVGHPYFLARNHLQTIHVLQQQE